MSVTYTFAGLILDEALYELRRGAAAVKLEPKVFDVLRYLVRHRERVVSKDELLAELWPGEHVSESVLPRCITALRKAVGDTAAGQRVIQTVHGRGYRFVAPLEIAAVGGAAADGEVALAREDGPAEPARGAFVGREDAMAKLRAALADALGGAGRLVLLVGEPGIGKTRTAEEIATDGRRAGALVLAGRCYEGDGAPAFWPWLQILRAAGAAPEAAPVLARLGGGVADVAQLLPELFAGHALRPGAALEPEQARFRLFDAVSALLRALAASRPLVLVVDDLH
ncbi:MAG TPA: AAA family ATPase, partial [Candidatus Binatia bacterium]